MSGTIHSLGHSTRSAEEFLALLRAAGVEHVADVRRFPGSRRHPWFRREALEETLAGAGLGYTWLGERLGGRMPETLPPERSPNRAWQEPSFRRYADAMATPPFQEAVAELETLATQTPVALLCAERLWWQCHRRLLADLLTARGWRVLHWLDPQRPADPHRLAEWARLDEEGRLSYPGLL